MKTISKPKSYQNMLPFLSLTLFMIGATIENSWLSSFLLSEGYSDLFIRQMMLMNGLIVAICSWLCSFLTIRFGSKKMFGVASLALIVTTLGILYSLQQHIAILLLIVYTLKGMVYPLFAYATLTLVIVTTAPYQLGKVTAYFWLAFNLGMTIIGPVLSSMLLKMMGISQLFYVATAIGVLGALLMLRVGKTSFQIKGKKNPKLLSELWAGLVIYQKQPKLCLALGAKIINTIGQFGFVIMMPIIFQAQGRSIVTWGAVWSVTFIANTLAGVLFGYLSDQLGWKRTVMYVGGPLTGMACLLILWSLYLTQSLPVVFAAFILFGIGLAGYGPLSALIPHMISGDKAIGVSVLNMGTGLSSVLGPGLVSILFFALGGIKTLLIFAILYFLSSFLLMPID
ncbi:MFS transporter [Pseudolactococcus reticulitermitis]|uniref:Major facilitator superfamily (MFS) profile domain-containing protein n=1 Tax=Pseudolactococcus reticulitermitis TaxID=2025039 RepID=A0A224XBU1_9LACT|nr:MFS transporter [Lactococcus reticulitermitis]GAX47111.1 hypothetical protein RsY01_693 [Lactococcus reticulitermitis]